MIDLNRHRKARPAEGPAPTPEPGPDRTVPTPATIVWGRVQEHASKLFDALDALDEAGGVVRASSDAGWTPRARRRSRALLESAREALAAHIAALDRLDG